MLEGERREEVRGDAEEVTQLGPRTRGPVRAREFLANSRLVGQSDSAWQGEGGRFHTHHGT